MKKKKLRRRLPPQTIYERALADAKIKRDRCVAKRTDYLMRLDEVNRQIPFLERVIDALTPPPLVPVQLTGPAQSYTVATPETMNEAPPSAPEKVEIDQANYLARFMPRSGRTTVSESHPARHAVPDNSSDPDEFLSDDHGTEILS